MERWCGGIWRAPSQGAWCSLACWARIFRRISWPFQTTRSVCDFSDQGAGAASAVFRCHRQRSDRRGVHHTRLLVWQGKGADDVQFHPVQPSAAEYLSWFYYVGGKPLMDGIYKKNGLKSIICSIIRAGGVGLVPQEDQDTFRPQGPQDALLRAWREGDAKAWRRAAIADG